MIAALFFAAVLPSAEPRVVHTFQIPSWSTEADDDSIPHVNRGDRVVIWSIACEPSTDATTFDNPTSSRCFPAKLHLPAWVPDANTGAPAKDMLQALDRCYRTDVKKAPDAVVAAVLKQDTDAVNAALNAQTTPTFVVTARESWDTGEHAIDVQLQAGSLALPLPTSAGPLSLSLVDAPSSRAVLGAIRKHQYRRAVTIAKAALKGTDDDDVHARAVGNLALALALAGDVDVARSELAALGDNLNPTSDAGVAAQETFSAVTLWTSGGVSIGDPCGPTPVKTVVNLAPRRG